MHSRYLKALPTQTISGRSVPPKLPSAQTSRPALSCAAKRNVGNIAADDLLAECCNYIESDAKHAAESLQAVMAILISELLFEQRLTGCLCLDNMFVTARIAGSPIEVVSHLCLLVVLAVVILVER